MSEGKVITLDVQNIPPRSGPEEWKVEITKK